MSSQDTKCVPFSFPGQVMLRVSSFILNGFILRFIQAELLGVVNLRWVDIGPP